MNVHYLHVHDVVLYIYRGDSFREVFARLGEVRSLIPSSVNVMALTATATQSTRQAVIKHLNMQSPSIVYLPPTKTNVFYSVVKKRDLRDVVLSIGHKLERDGQNFPKMLIYCRKHLEVAEIYEIFHHLMGAKFTNPAGAPNLVKYRLVDMYTQCTEKCVKNEVVSRFVDPNSKLRIVIATTAFGMVSTARVCEYFIGVQLTTWTVMCSKREERVVTALCQVSSYYQASDRLHTAKEMMKYCTNEDTCRRELLFKDFDNASLQQTPPSLYRFCDVCKTKCKCGVCDVVLSAFVTLK